LKCFSLIRHFKPRLKLNSKMFKDRLDRYQILMPDSGISVCQPHLICDEIIIDRGGIELDAEGNPKTVHIASPLIWDADSKRTVIHPQRVLYPNKT
jgi:hypothetical protein